MKVIVFYGTDCNENTAWMPWLKHELGVENIDCIIPNLPTPKNQTYKKWAEIAKKIIIEEDDVVVGWSTGAIFAVRLLFESKRHVKKLILISGFNNYVGNVPEIDKINKDFFINNLDDAKTIADEIVCFKSDNDPFISQNALNSFAKELNAKVLNIARGGHFNASAGFLKFEELLKEILS